MHMAIIFEIRAVVAESPHGKNYHDKQKKRLMIVASRVKC